MRNLNLGKGVIVKGYASPEVFIYGRKVETGSIIRISRPELSTDWPKYGIIKSVSVEHETDGLSLKIELADGSASWLRKKSRQSARVLTLNELVAETSDLAFRLHLLRDRVRRTSKAILYEDVPATEGEKRYRERVYRDGGRPHPLDII